MYGAQPGDGSFASNCLLARRLAERGVRFIQLYHRDWDHHGGVKEDIALQGRGGGPADRGADHGSEAARHARRHAGRLGRRVRPHADVAGRRRPRPPHQGLLVLLAGGGIKGGISYGATDELGYAALENPVSVHDFHATMLHLLGIDHKRLTVKFQGLDARLTGDIGRRGEGYSRLVENPAGKSRSRHRIRRRACRFPGTHAACGSGWDDAACAAPWLRSGGCARA